MVFESVVTEVLNKILGDYVENLDRTQLKIGIWGGDVVLKNLKLRENALDDLDLPVQLVHGFLGKMVLKIPWKNLYGEPVVAQIEDFYLLISPKQSVEYNAEKEAKYDLDSKRAALAKIDEARRLELEKDKPKPDQSFTEKLTAQIVNNLQVKIENVHLRYEDTTTTGKPFAFGITLNQLELYTTDMDWMKCYMTEQATRVYKIANLDSLSVYMNCDATLFTETSDNMDAVSRMFRSNIARKELIPSRYNYIIGPISSIAKLQLNMNPEYDDPPFVIPKIDLYLEMEKLHIGISSTQFQDILKLTDSMNRLLLGQPYRKYRPFNKTYKGHYREWWRFAITSVLEEDIRRKNRYWCWDNIKQHRELCNTYATCVKEVQMTKKPAASLVETVNLCEQKLDLFNLVLIRNRVLLEVEKVKKAEEQRTSEQKGWFSWWGGGSKASIQDSSTNIVQKFEAAMTDSEKEKLYKAIGYEKHAEKTAMPASFEAIKMNFKLEALEIGVYDDIDVVTARRTMLLMNFTLATCSITQRPSANAISITAGVKEMKLTGLKSGDYVPTLIESQLAEDASLLDVFFETNPLDKQCDQRIRIRSRPLQVVYDGTTIVELAKAFTPPKSVNLSEIEEAASERMANFKERSATGMQFIVDNHQILEVDIKLMPNILILPSKGVYIPGEGSLIIVSLGELRVTTTRRKGELKDVAKMLGAGQERNDVLRTMMEMCYDRFRVSIEEIQVMVAKPTENWQQVLTYSNSCEMHVLQPTSVIVTIELCVINDDPRLPKAKVEFLIPSINIDLTEDRIFEALGIVSSLPLPESKEPEPTMRKSTSFLTVSRASVSKMIDQERFKVKAKRPTVEEMDTEIVQYTNLEINFALKKFGVYLYKSRPSDHEKYDETPSDKFRTPIEEMAPDEFVDTSATLNTGRNEDDRMLSMQVLQVEGYMAQRTYELVATAKLGAVNVTVYDNEENKKNVLSIIDTPRTDTEVEYLLTISYIMANKTTPEFSSRYNSIEQLILIDFAKLVLTLHQESLLKLMHFGKELQQKLDTFNTALGPKDRIATTDTEGVLAKLATIIEEPESKDAKLRPELSHRRRKVVDSIKIKVNAKLEMVSVLLTCRKRDLALLLIQNFSAGVIIKSSYTELNVKLKDFIVRDLNPVTVHPTVVSIVGDNAFKFQIVVYNLEETANYNSDNVNILVRIGCVRILFLNWFVTSVLSFLNNFQAAQQALVNASAAAADAAKQNAINAYEEATRLKLNIKISAPVIIVPVNSFSYDALCLDLGSLNLTNVITEVNVDKKHSHAILDEVKLELKDMQLAKVQIIPPTRESEELVRLSLDDYSSSSIDDTSLYGVTGYEHMLDPLSFTLILKRNLSIGWYKDLPEINVSGHLKSITLNLHPEDYVLLMDILSKNLSEGQHEFHIPPPKVHKVEEAVVSAEVHRKTVLEGQPPSRTPSAKKIALATDKHAIYEQFKFNLQFDGVVVNFYQANKDGLARFGIHFLSLKGKMLIDGTLSTSVVLCDIQIDDIRPNVKSKITKYLCRKEWKQRESEVSSIRPSAGSLKAGMEKNYMLDLTAIIKENDTFAEVRVCGFDLIITIDFLITLAEFFKLPELEFNEAANTPVVIPGDTKSAPRTPKKTVSTPVKTSDKKLNLMLYIEEPDIILIESLEDFNTKAIIFNAQVRLNYRGIGSKELISGQIDALKMYMCSFVPERRDATKHYILHPCVISLQGSTPDQEGLHISIKLTDITLNVSPAAIELINKAMVTLSSSTEQVTTNVKEFDQKALWIVEKFNEKKFWFLVDQAYDALEVEDVPEELVISKTEKCIVEVPSITLAVETGVGYYTTPLLTVEMRMDCTIANWSRNMKIDGSLSLYTNYYNQELGMWEPLIEQVEKVDKSGMIEYIPWEVQFGLEIQHNISEIDDVENATTKITIESEEMLEITLSKTCLETLTALGEAFSYAIDSKGLTKPEVIAPYVVENDTGFDISLNFTRGIFTLHECHMPNASSRTDALNRALVFQCEDADQDLLPNEVKDCTISPGGKAYLQTKVLLTINSPEDEAYNIYVTVGGIDKEVVLPVSKSDRRYFPLYRDTNQDPWGIISQVTSEYGTTKVNIHGVVNVHNHFTTTVNVYRNKQNSTEKILVGVVASGEVFHVPLHAIYAESKELYFSLPGYNVSIQGIKWNDCPTDFNYQRHLQCDPVDTFESLYINTVRMKTEVFHEHTMKFMLLSAFYTIHLRPPLYLRNALPIDIKVSVAGCTVRHVDVGKSPEMDQIDAVKPFIKEDLLDYGEKQVDPGDVLHLPTVQLTGRRKETKSYVVVRLIQYLEKDWSCTTEISEDHEEYATWTFSSYDSAAKMEMDLNVRFQDRFGSLMLTVYSPFWMINKTGLMLSYKTNFESVNVLYHPPEYNGPILFSFREKYFFDKKRVSIRVDNGEWSEKIPLDIAGASGQVACDANEQSYQIGVHNHLTNNSLTKQITFIPYYIVTNKCNYEIELQEHSRPGDPWTLIKQSGCVPFWPKSEARKAILKVSGQTTVPFNYSEVQCILLKLESNQYGGINVDVQVTEGGVYITFTNYAPGDAPGLLINHASQTIAFHEKGSVNHRVLEPSEEVLFTWSDPAGQKLLLLGRESIENDLRRDGVGQLTLEGGGKAFWVSFLDGLQRVLLFTEVADIAEKVVGSTDMQKVTRTMKSFIFELVTQEIEVRIHGIGFSVLNNTTGVDILYLGVKSSGIIWEYKKEGKKRFKQFNIVDSLHMEEQYQAYLLAKEVKEKRLFYLDMKYQIDFDNMIYHKHTQRLIKRTFYPGFWFDLKTSPYQTQLHAKINKIQIDNQLTDCIFPVVLAPIPPPKSIAATSVLKPFIECSVVERVVPNSTINQFKYCKLLIQEFHFKLDILFLTAIAELFTAEQSDDQAAKLFNEDVDSIERQLSNLVETHSAQEQKNFYDNLHLGPLKIHVSFSMAGSDTTALPGLLSTLVQGVGVTLTDANDVVFKLAFFEREFGFFTHKQLQSEITAHYVGQALKQLYVLVLGLDVIGNPYGLVVGLKTGVQDLFYEPFQGAIQGPGEFAEGLVLGVKSLFGHTVGGAAGAVSKITGAMGKGLAVLTFDEDYQKKRRQALNKRPANFQEGIARSGKGLVMGVVDGVSGVFTKPISGAKEEGVEGFFKGLGKGAIGLVARPTAGVVDFASGSFEAVKRATESSEDAQRLRPPRFMHLDNVLRPYSLSEAQGNKLLKEIEKGKYARTDSFSHCEEVIAKQEVVLVSNHRVIYATKNDLFGNWSIHWTYLWNEISSIFASDRGVEIVLRKENKKVLGLFASSEGQRKVITIPQRARREFLANLMESLRTGT